MQQPSTIQTTNSFYVRAEMCYDNHCREIEIPWLTEFELTANRKMLDIAILSQQFGKWPPGLYVRPDLQNWRFALSYTDVCALLLTANTVKVIVGATAASAGPVTVTNAVLFKNATQDDTLNISPSPYDVYVIVGLEATKNAPDGTVTKNPPATKANVLQVSAGAGRDIKDYAPTPLAAGGIASIDADGIVTVLDPASLIDDYTLSAVNNQPTPFVAADPTDPSIDLMREGTVVSTLTLNPVRGLDGTVYGMLVTGTQ